MADKEFFTSYPSADVPPFKVMPSGGANNWYFIANANGLNCLADRGRVFAAKEQAEKIAADWNAMYG